MRESSSPTFRRPTPFTSRFVIGVLLTSALVSPPSAVAQFFPRARLEAVQPPGAKAGSSVELTLIGADLEEVALLYFSDPSIKADLIPESTTPPEKGKPTPPKQLRFKVNVPANIPLGVHDVRAVGKWGISNPRAFVVSDLDEVQEKEPNNDAPQAQKIVLNTTVNGDIATTTDVDYYTFEGKKGQRVVVHCAAFTIDSKLQPQLELIGPGGKLLASGRDYRASDAVVDAVLSGDGDCTIRVCHFTYTLGKANETFYRLRVTTAPWIDVVFPPVFEEGKATEATLFGRNLPGGRLDPKAVSVSGVSFETLATRLDAAKKPNRFMATLLPRAGGLELREVRLRNEAGWSNAGRVVGVKEPVVIDNGDNDTPEKAQSVTLPAALCGRIDSKRDRDWYTFRAKKDDVYLIEGFADRLGSPTDLYFQVWRADNGQIVSDIDGNTEVPSRVGQLWTHTDDPFTRFVAPADGEYRLIVGSWTASGRAGPRSTYCVRVRRETPDFTLLLVDSAEGGGGMTVHRGGHQDFRVVCLRHGGFDGEVLLEAEALPNGVTCPPQVLGPKVAEGALVVSAAGSAALWAGEIKVKGTALLDGEKRTREACTATLVWPTNQRNVLAISRLSRSLCLAVRDKGPFALDVPVRELVVPVGGKAEVTVNVRRQLDEMKNVQIQVARLSAPSQSNGQPINVPNVNIAGNRTDAVVKFQLPANTPPGTYSLVLQGRAKFSYISDPKTKQKKNVDAVETTPPVRVVVYDRVAELAFAPGEASVRPGAETAVTVKVRRLHGYKGPFKVEIVPPSGVQGISAASLTLAAGANEGQLLLKAAKDVKPTTNASFLVRATATLDGVSLKTEEKFQLTVGANAPVDSHFQTLKLLEESAAAWKYEAAEKVKGDGWHGMTFDAKSWQAGKTPFGYGETEIETRKGTMLALKGQAVLFRREFEAAADLLSRKGVLLRVQIASDDNAVVYLNGQRVDEDTADHEFAYWNREVTLRPDQLRPGKNVLAVRVNNGNGSSDLYFDAAVVALIPTKVPPK